MDRLGEWVLRQACQDAAAWPDDQLTLSVNVSAVQLRSSSFPAMLQAALADSGLSPARVVLELTETALISDVGSAQTMLDQLRDQGLRVSVDDFGTGYSTLLTLQHLHADELKIDRSFIQALGQAGKVGQDSEAIVQATLGLAVVAEGVETVQQAERLRAMGCPAFQGWLIAPGLRAPEFSRRFAQLAGTPGPGGRCL